jgi:hypothetical protein
VFALCVTEKIWVKEGNYLLKEKKKKEMWGKKEIRISYLRLMILETMRTKPLIFFFFWF